MITLNSYEMTYIITAFLFQVALITHFALRKWRFDQAIRYGRVVYALSIPAVAVSIVFIFNHQPWFLWLGGLLYLIWAVYGYWIEYVREIEWRNSLRWSVLVPYITLYLATVMLYWWPVAQIYKPLWYVFTLLFISSTFLNVTSHKRGETIVNDAELSVDIQN